MRLSPSLLWPAAAAALLVGALAAGCRRQPAAEPATRTAEATPAPDRRPADGSVLAAELAAALPHLKAAEPRGCRTPPAGLPPQLRVDAACRVQVTVVVRGDPGAVEARIAAAGGMVTRRGGQPPRLQVWAPPALLEALATDPDVAAVRVPSYARPVAR